MSDEQSEFVMRFAGERGEQGEQGAQGAQGERGAAGLDPPVRYAIIFLFCMTLFASGVNLLWTSHLVNSGRAAQERAGAAVERKLCATFGKLAALRPPPGNPAANPSRAYLQSQHAALAEIGTDLRCGQETR